MRSLHRHESRLKVRRLALALRCLLRRRWMRRSGRRWMTSEGRGYISLRGRGDGLCMRGMICRGRLRGLMNGLRVGRGRLLLLGRLRRGLGARLKQFQDGYYWRGRHLMCSVELLQIFWTTGGFARSSTSQPMNIPQDSATYCMVFC